ncbi:MAG TPA: DUF120 domain-containing protein [Methanomicrobiales archaeon]|nr:DUF120 domain-containing protein [Methanomicrobiales archaeon]
MVEAEDLECLKALALLGGHKGPVWISSPVLAKTLSLSPQTISRRLKSLESQLLISRSIRADGQYITITERGEKELHREYSDYLRIFGRDRHHYTLKGTVISGIGEGRYYVSLLEYCRQFLEYLGWRPFPGTLNIKLDPASMITRRKLEALDWIRIIGFTSDNRTFGDARVLSCRIGTIPCAIIVPGRTHYPEDIIEVIAPLELRRELHLEDNDTVTLEIAYD